MKHLALLLFPVLLLTGCTTVVKYESKAAPGPAKPADYPIYVYQEKVEVPRPFEIIGVMHVHETPFTVFGGSVEGEMNTLLVNARKMGADAVQITSVEDPDFLHAKYRVNANLIRFTNVWDFVSLTEEELLAYFRTHEKTLDPIEGIWFGNDAMQSRVGIMKNNAMPGPDFIAFILDSINPTWQPGDKKMELTKGEWTSGYRGNYYLDDYRLEQTVFTLRGPFMNTFIVYLSEDAPVVFSRE